MRGAGKSLAGKNQSNSEMDRMKHWDCEDRTRFDAIRIPFDTTEGDDIDVVRSELSHRRCDCSGQELLAE